MKTLPNRAKPYTAAQYLTYHKTTRNRKACEWLDIQEAAFRGGCYIITAVAIATATGGLIASLLKF